MGEKGTEAIEKLPRDYHIKRTDAGGLAEPEGPRPGLPLQWDGVHKVWTPPGYVTDASDPDRVFNKTTGKNGVWDETKQQWVDTETAKPLGYEQ